MRFSWNGQRAIMPRGTRRTGPVRASISSTMSARRARLLRALRDASRPRPPSRPSRRARRRSQAQGEAVGHARHLVHDPRRQVVVARWGRRAAPRVGVEHANRASTTCATRRRRGAFSAAQVHGLEHEGPQPPSPRRAAASARCPRRRRRPRPGRGPGASMRPSRRAEHCDGSPAAARGRRPARRRRCRG